MNADVKKSVIAYEPDVIVGRVFPFRRRGSEAQAIGRRPKRFVEFAIELRRLIGDAARSEFFCGGRVGWFGEPFFGCGAFTPRVGRRQFMQ